MCTFIYLFVFTPALSFYLKYANLSQRPGNLIPNSFSVGPFQLCHSKIFFLLKQWHMCEHFQCSASGISSHFSPHLTRDDKSVIFLSSSTQILRTFYSYSKITVLILLIYILLSCSFLIWFSNSE